MGGADSPSIFSRVLATDLQTFTDLLPTSVFLIQYVDDLLLSADTAELCQHYTCALLLHLHTCGYKVNRSKLQFCQTSVTFLGMTLSKGAKLMGPQVLTDVQRMHLPTSVKELRSVLGLFNFCRLWIPAYSSRILPFRKYLKGNPPGYASVSLSQSDSTALECLMSDILQAPQLHLPNSCEPIYMYVFANAICWAAVATQQEGCIIGHFSGIFTPIEQAFTSCERNICACAAAVEKLYSHVIVPSVTIYTSHDVPALLKSNTLHFVPARVGQCTAVLLRSHISFKGMPPTNPFNNLKDLLLFSAENHDCTSEEIPEERPFMGIVPVTDLPPSHVVIFSDGSQTETHTGFAVCQIDPDTKEIIQKKQYALPPDTSAQLAEIAAALEGFRLMNDKNGVLYTDSAYVTTTTHTNASKWHKRGFVTGKGTPLQHHDTILAIMEVLQERHNKGLKTSCEWVKAHQHNVTDIVAYGNQIVDELAKQTTNPLTIFVQTRAKKYLSTSNPFAPIRVMQESATSAETDKWVANECSHYYHNNEPPYIWMHPSGVPALPIGECHLLAHQLHYGSHMPTNDLINTIREMYWCPDLKDICKAVVNTCNVCFTNTSHQTPRIPPGAIPRPAGPFREWHIDFTDMVTPCKGYRSEI
ncbi:uncharacterized protein LOC121401507 [Xenopus laevis]|uniref:ribonuclease H n=2 Tax=Xenopus laevis TaxID=8355 RepID=A0A8J1MLS4_XENLA|nr:uncharacterized protein LOC121401507 [Xenopus laevis]